MEWVLIYSFTFLFLLWNENGKRERGEQDEVIIGVNDKQDEAKGVLKGELILMEKCIDL